MRLATDSLQQKVASEKVTNEGELSYRQTGR